MAALTKSKILNDAAPDINRSATKKGTYVFRRPFFFRSGGTAENWVATVSRALANNGLKFEVVDKGEVDKPFKGGASVANQSHWYVEMKIDFPEGTK